MYEALKLVGVKDGLEVIFIILFYNLYFPPLIIDPNSSWDPHLSTGQSQNVPYLLSRASFLCICCQSHGAISSKD